MNVHGRMRAAVLGPVGRWCDAAFALDARSLAAYRMALGAIICADCLLRARDFSLMVAVDGILPPDVIRRCHADPTVWSLAFLDDSTWWNAVVLALEGVAGLLLAAGVATRWSTVAAWVLVWSIIRRTGPASCGGDVWLACQLFWSMFIPLGTAWSWDARRRGPAGFDTAPVAIRSVATAALVLQLLAVYVSAGVAKCNASWVTGGALAHALSMHDHGTSLGAALVGTGLVGDWLARAVVAFEILVPLLVLVRPTPRVRLLLVAAFVGFHTAIGLTMTVGLFVPIGMAAWLPLLPSAWWDRGGPLREPVMVTGLGRIATRTCSVALLAAALSLANARWWHRQPPRAVVAALNVVGLHQDWRMFGTVAAEEQWMYARAELADGRVVDLLRDGAPCDGGRPEGGFTSLADNRWHNVCWCLGWPGQWPIAPAVAAGLARHWNANHPPEARVVRLEIHHARQGVGAGDAVEREALVGSWPPRDAAGRGNLDRLLEATGGGDEGP